MFRRFALVASFAVLCALFCATTVAAAPPAKITLPARYTKWLKEDVGFIITDEEQKAFAKLSTDEERDRFIDDFWEVRNPIRGRTPNSYKEEHYWRLQYAKDNFGRRSNTPGWMTDQGRAWILFGKPVSHAQYLGYGQLYPCELWFYENNTGSTSLPGYFTLLFYMPYDASEFKFYRPSLDGPMMLVRGSQFNSNKDVYNFLAPINGELAKAAFTLVPGDPMDKVTYTTDMSSDMMVNRITNFANDPFNVMKLREIRSLRESVHSKLLVNDETPLAIETFVLADPIGQFWLDYHVPLRDASQGKLMAGRVAPAGSAPPVTPEADSRLSVATSFRLLGAAGDVIAEDEEEQSFLAFAPDGNFHPFQLSGRLPVNPGSYTLEFRIMDREHSRVFTGEKKFTVGTATGAALSGLVAFSGVKPSSPPDPTAPFQYFGAQFFPVAAGEQAATDPLRLLYALDVPEAKEYAVEYVIAHLTDRDSRRTIKDTIPAAEFRNGHLLKSKTIPLGDLPVGSYRVVVTIRAAEDQPVLASASTSIRLAAKSDLPLLFFLDSVHRTAAPAGASYIRGLEAISTKDNTAAAKYMKQALDLNAANDSAARYLVQAYFENHEYSTITGVYKKAGMKPFESSAELLAQISLSFARTGDRRQAQEILDSAKSLFPQNLLLAAAAKAVAR